MIPHLVYDNKTVSDLDMMIGTLESLSVHAKFVGIVAERGSIISKIWIVRVCSLNNTLQRFLVLTGIS